MSAPSVASRAASPPPGLPIYRFTPDQFQQLSAAGIFTTAGLVELHDGTIVARNNGTRMPLRFTVEQYERMIDLGILTEDTEVELLDGWIVPKMSRNAPHDAALYYTHMALIRRLPAAWICRAQSGMTTDTSQPEPDLTVVLGPAERYEDHHPTAQETALAIEVSDSSIGRDRVFKGFLYANASIPIYWIIDIAHNRVEVYAEPTITEAESAYRQRCDYGTGENIPLVLAGIEVDTIPVQELLPRGPMVQPS